MEGRVSQIFDLGLVLCYVEEGILKQQITKVTRFLS